MPIATTCAVCGAVLKSTPTAKRLLALGVGACFGACNLELTWRLCHRGKATRRFWERVNRSPGQGPNGDCWEWQAGQNGNGYGQLGVYDSATRFASVLTAHVISFRLHHGPVPKGHYVLHRCDNPPCCNPDHLLSGTQKLNVEMAALHGRPNGRKRKDVCVRGHQRIEANLYLPSGKCRLCAYERYHGKSEAAQCSP